MAMLRDNINRLLSTPKRDPDDASLRDFLQLKLQEYDTALATIAENNRTQLVHIGEVTTAEKEAE